MFVRMSSGSCNSIVAVMITIRNMYELRNYIAFSSGNMVCLYACNNFSMTNE